MPRSPSILAHFQLPPFLVEGAVRHENQFLSSESRRLEVLVSQAREEVAAAKQAAATNESEAATLRSEVERLEGLLAAEKASHEEEMRRGARLGDQLQTTYQEKAALEEEIETLKGSATAEGKGVEEGCDSVDARAGTPKDQGVVPPALVRGCWSSCHGWHRSGLV
ncbi:hypothetical protein ZEAMMB73_Zm00001d033939 [Zea mays]|uniref:Uncharacterized protein n=2 Tax=Zea mays TaxID=4577 RepID=A0A1D6L3I6_MAIZE|nr:hypothetical protein ZEAMMB73_Zm00001d033939 [Zea mays]